MRGTRLLIFDTNIEDSPPLAGETVATFFERNFEDSPAIGGEHFFSVWKFENSPPLGGEDVGSFISRFSGTPRLLLSRTF